MIVLNLCCSRGHRFEGWFRSSADFDAQKARGVLSCPACEDASIVRLPSGPRVLRGAQEEGGAPKTAAAPVDPRAEFVRKLVEAVIRNTEDVGRRFPEEVRKIHYREVEERAIRGIASREEAAELAEEGIAVLPFPVLPDTTH